MNEPWAQFIEVSDDGKTITLRTMNGKHIAISLSFDSLSVFDEEYVRNRMKGGNDFYLCQQDMNILEEEKNSLTNEQSIQHCINP